MNPNNNKTQMNVKETMFKYIIMKETQKNKLKSKWIHEQEKNASLCNVVYNVVINLRN